MQSTKFAIAVLEDDEGLRLELCQLLRRAGVPVWGAASVEDLFLGLRRMGAELVLADSALVEHLATYAVPVMLVALSGCRQDAQRTSAVRVLPSLLHPDDLRERVVRYRRELLESRAQLGSHGPRPERDGEAWHLDKTGSRLRAPNRSVVPLTTREQELIHHLMTAGEAMVSKRELLEAMGYQHVDNGFHRIESQLARLRRKTLLTTGMALPVRAVFGRGLMFAP